MPLKIMPLGDSITAGADIPGGYRIDLWNRLDTSGLSVDFVGSLSNGPSSLGDKDHEGHGGWRIDQIANSVNGWLNAQQPDIITLMIGTNDMFDSSAGSTTPNRLSALIDRITNLLPNAHLLVASIPPFRDATINQRVLAFNSTLPNIVSSKSVQGKKVTFVDIYSRLTLSDLGADGFHPNEEGYSKIAQAWESAIRSITSTTPIASSQSNFNGDNQTDILWRNTATGENSVWLMNGTNLAQGVAVTPVADPNWSIGGTGDFNSDRQTDILWHNSATGDNSIWLMNGTNLAQGVAVTPVADPNWSIGGTGDFNSDRHTDILWRNTATGENSVWLMNGTNLAQGVAVTPVADPNWSIGGTGDFNGDHQTDILWHNSATGDNSIWLMNGTKPAQYVAVTPVADPNWSIGGTGDFNSDRHTDILWRNTATGKNIVWLMDGTNLAQYFAITPVADLGWQIVS